MRRKKNERGFAYREFKDQMGVECRIQKSSLATTDAIWFGAKEIGLQEFISGRGWEEVKLEHSTGHHFVANNSMHLTRLQVKKLLPILQKFVETGEI